MSYLSERIEGLLAQISELAEEVQCFKEADASDVDELFEQVDGKALADIKLISQWCDYTAKSVVGNAIQKEMQRAFREGPATKASVITELCKAVKGLGLEDEIISFGSMMDLD